MSERKIKKVLIIQYSQTGQLSRVVESISQPLQSSEFIDVQYLTLEPEKSYPFPWSFFTFFDVFPECVYLDSPELKPFNLDADFDLILLPYQVWFLSPSLPVTAFLKSENGKRLLKDTPVITVIGCRNMWVMAQEAVKKMLNQAQAKLIDNIVLVDQGSALASFITTPRWLLTGKKSAFGKFPAAGISDADINNASRFGVAIRDGLANNLELSGEPMLAGLNGVEVDVSLLQSEKIGYRSFRIWGKLLRKIGKQGDPKRKPVLVIYFLFLVLMIITVVPVNMLIKRLLAPLLKDKQANLKAEFEQPSGSGSERMGQY